MSTTDGQLVETRSDELDSGRTQLLSQRSWSRILVGAAIVFWVVLSIAHCGRAFLVLWSERHLTIYPVYHTAGQAWLTGDNLYMERDHYDTFRYSPLVAACLVPCGMQSVVGGCFTWRAFNLIVFLAGLIAFERTTLVSWSVSRRAGFYLLAGMAGASGLLDAVCNAPVVGLMLLGLACAQRQRWTFSACALALAVLFKIYPIAAALLFVLLWPRQLAWRFALALLVGLGLPFLLAEPGWVLAQYKGWYQVVKSDTGRQDWSLDRSYRDLRLLFRVWAVAMPAWVYTLVQLSSAALLAVLTLWARRLSDSRKVGLYVLGLAVCWMLVLGPATEGTTYILLSPFIAWAVLDAWDRPGHFWARVGMTFAFVLMIVTCAIVWFPLKRFHNYGPHPVCGIFVAVYLTGRLWGELGNARQKVGKSNSGLDEQMLWGDRPYPKSA